LHLYATGVDTGLRYTWKGDHKFEAVPSTVTGPGDGTVNLASLKSVAKWATEQTSGSFQEKIFDGQSHTGILSYPPYIAAVLNVLGLNASSVETAESDFNEQQLPPYSIPNGAAIAGVERI
jgi:hypothetical protein